MNDFLRTIVWYNYFALALLVLVMPFWGVVLGATIIFIGDLYVVIEWFVGYIKMNRKNRELVRAINNIDLIGKMNLSIKDTLEQQHKNVWYNTNSC